VHPAAHKFIDYRRGFYDKHYHIIWRDGEIHHDYDHESKLSTVHRPFFLPT
jgi:hypothetical protein